MKIFLLIFINSFTCIGDQDFNSSILIFQVVLSLIKLYFFCLTVIITAKIIGILRRTIKSKRRCRRKMNNNSQQKLTTAVFWCQGSSKDSHYDFIFIFYWHHINEFNKLLNNQRSFFSNAIMSFQIESFLYLTKSSGSMN